MANEILTFCGTDTGSNLLTQAEYDASTDRTSGNKPGIASAKLVNRALRQSAFIASQFAQFLTDRTGSDIDDDNDTAALLAIINDAAGRQSITSKTSAYPLTSADQTVLGDTAGGTFALTLPSAVGCLGRVYTLKKISSDFAVALTIATTGGETIDGVTSRALYTVNETLVVQSDGANWQILDHKCNTDWESYALTIGASSPPTKGTIVRDQARWRRVGKNVQIRYDYAQSVAGAAGSGNYTFPTPSGIAADFTQIANNQIPTLSDPAFTGSGYLSAVNDITGDFVTLQVLLITATTMWLARATTSPTAIIGQATGVGGLNNAAMQYSFQAEFPVANWFA